MHLMAFSPPLKIGNCHFKLFLCDILAHKPTTHLCTLIILSQQLLVEAGVFVLQISNTVCVTGHGVIF